MAPQRTPEESFRRGRVNAVMIVAWLGVMCAIFHQFVFAAVFLVLAVVVWFRANSLRDQMIERHRQKQ